MRSMTAADIRAGDSLRPLVVPVTAQKIISGAAATRDWQPIHHDHDAAVKAGLRGIIMNSPTQAGWISKYITDWTGPAGQVQRMSFRMKDSICPGDEMQLQGQVTAKDALPDGRCLVTVSVTLSVAGTLKTQAEVRVNVPTAP